MIIFLKNLQKSSEHGETKKQDVFKLALMLAFIWASIVRTNENNETAVINTNPIIIALFLHEFGPKFRSTTSSSCSCSLLDPV